MKMGVVKAVMMLAVVTLALPAVAGAEMRVRPVEWAQPVMGLSLGNLYQVSPELYRSSQPDEDDLQALAVGGVRSVLNLREFHSDDADAAPELKLYAVPMNAGEVNDAVIAKAMIALAQAPKPVLVHCWHGSDRTGVVVAMYRMVFQNWPREKAIDEFVNGGFGYHQSVYPEIEKYLATVDVDRFRKVVAGVRSGVAP